jgi:hypothetical protein
MARKLLTALGTFLILPLTVLAQDAPKVEVSGGFSYLRTVELSSFNLYGWNASVAGNMNPWFGVVGDLGGNYASPSSGVFGVAGVNVSAHTFLFGPRFSYRGAGRTTMFCHALFGAAHGSAGGFGITARDTAFAMALGGGFDIHLANSVAFRALQLDYLMTRFGGDRQNSVRLMTGIVLGFGK